MFQSATLVPTHPTSPWRGPRQLSLSSVSRVKVEGKQLRLASPPSVSLCSSPLLPHLLQVLPVSRSLFEAAAWPRSPLLPPQTHSSCGSSRPLLHAGLDKTRCSSWASLGHAEDCGCVSARSPRHIFTQPRCLSLSIPANESGAPWLH